MRVGIKYCGGCNPRYDRSALVAQLKKALPQVDFQPVCPGESYDLLLVVSGCHVECADTSGILHSGRVGVFSAGHLETAVEQIKAHIQK